MRESAEQKGGVQALMAKWQDKKYTKTKKFLAGLALFWVAMGLYTEIPRWYSLAKGEFRFENYYSPLTRWAGGSREAAASQISTELQKLYPPGTPVKKVVDYLIALDENFKFYDKPFVDQEGTEIPGHSTKRYRFPLAARGYVGISDDKKRKEFRYSYTFEPKSPYLLFLTGWNYQVFIEVHYDNDRLLTSIITEVSQDKSNYL